MTVVPLAVYTTNEVYYRITISNEERDGNLTEQTALLEKREGPRGEWTELSRAEPSEAGYLLESIAEKTGMEATSANADDLQEVTDGKQELFKATSHAGRRRRTGTNGDSAASRRSLRPQGVSKANE